MKKIEEMTIGDVICSQLFQRKLNTELRRIEREEARLRKKLPEVVIFCAHPYDTLQRRKEWEVAPMAQYFAEIMNKTCKLPSNMRAYITQVCRPILLLTIKELKENGTTNEQGETS